MNPNTALTIGAILALAGTIAALILITPAKKRDGLHPFLKFVHDLFNFKFLIIEKILQFLYILLTLFCIAGGFFMLFSSVDYGFGYSQSFAGTGLVFMILGPVIIRLFYELLMMAILLVKNVIQINNKLKNQNEGNTESVFDAQPELNFTKEDNAE